MSHKERKVKMMSTGISGEHDVKKNKRSQDPNKITIAPKCGDSKKIFEADLVPRLRMKLRKRSDQ
ncbi:hypothetical protein WA026_012472 [Henosepilachna vigintioctopunctata]|uniref:Uncharacterized protein n=1 Tax=Henosepilachna vigintioctopunctata TaxID=420089 RepID=A0AAW1V0E7_9CUCU